MPWQNTQDPYRVWLSEIMLQQTQVATVLGYYERFLERFPDVKSLACAPQDEVMGMWSGLGYYTRARNLHRCAQQVMALHGGAFPKTAAELAGLPGIGRSTANAIASFCFSERVAILDANVRRVLSRALAFGEDLASSKNEKLLWEHADALLPTKDIRASMPRYTQGLMDLGSAVCVPKSPDCKNCPLADVCKARREGNTEKYPVKTRKLKRKAESWMLLLLRDDLGRFWLEKRPSVGIWAGMHCPIVCHDRVEMEGIVTGRGVARGSFVSHEMPSFVHVLTHRDLHLHPVVITVDSTAQPVGDGVWLTADDWNSVGLPAPIRKLMESLHKQPVLV